MKSGGSGNHCNEDNTTSANLATFLEESAMLRVCTAVMFQVLGVYAVTCHAVAGDSDLAASLFSAVLHNHRDIEEMDVRFELEYVAMKPDSQLTLRTIKARIARGSKEQGLTLFARIAESQEFDSEDGNPTEHNVAAYVIGPRNQVQQVDAFGKKTANFPSKLIRNARIGIPDLETIGFVSFPHIAPLAGSDDPYWESLMVPSDESVAYPSTDGHAKVIQKHFHDDQFTGETIWRFDLTRLMPTQRRMYYRDANGKLQLKEIENYEWKLVNGVNVPKSIRCEVRQNYRNEETGELVGFSEIYTTEFNWKSVNTPISTNVFELEDLKTANDIKDIILPE